MNTTTKTGQAAPPLAQRMRKAARILLRAACLHESDAPVGKHTTARGFTMTGLVRMAREDLYPEPRTKRPDVEPGEAAPMWALALVWQEPIDRTPDAGELARAAKMLFFLADCADLDAVRQQIERIPGVRLESSVLRPEARVEVGPEGVRFMAGFSCAAEPWQSAWTDRLADLPKAVAAKIEEHDPVKKLREQAREAGFALVEAGKEVAA